MQELLIESVQTDGTQSRAQVNKEHIADLAELIKAGKRLPPITVYSDKQETWLADGYHRLQAHVEAGKRSIKADVKRGSKDDAAWAGCGANQAHGLRRTNADKRKAVQIALKLKPDMSDRAVAEHCGVTNHLVAELRREMGVSQVRHVGELPPDRLGRDGKKYPPPPPQKPNPQSVVQKQEPQKPRPPVPRPAEVPIRNNSYKPEKSNSEIPDHLTLLFERGDEVQALLSKLSEIRSALKNADGDELYAECDLAQVAAAISQAYDGLKATIPFAVCPWCHGEEARQKDCRGCHGRGVIGKFRYDTAVPKELKGE
jgi:hypothetical protein